MKASHQFRIKIRHKIISDNSFERKQSSANLKNNFKLFPLSTWLQTVFSLCANDIKTSEEEDVRSYATTYSGC